MARMTDNAIRFAIAKHLTTLTGRTYASSDVTLGIGEGLSIYAEYDLPLVPYGAGLEALERLVDSVNGEVPARSDG